MCAVSTNKALLRSSASIVTVVTKGPHALTGRAQPLPAATATATGLLTKVGSDLDAACGAVGAAVASDVRGEYTRSAPPFVRFHSHCGDKGATHTRTGCAQPLPAATATAHIVSTRITQSDLQAPPIFGAYPLFPLVMDGGWSGAPAAVDGVGFIGTPLAARHRSFQPVGWAQSAALVPPADSWSTTAA